MKKVVVKFGGSNLKRKEDIARVIKAVKLYRQPVVIVISALYGVTDILVNAIRDVKTDENAISVLKENLLDIPQAFNHVLDNLVETNGF